MNTIETETSSKVKLGVLLAVGLLLRIPFMSNEGFAIDVHSFEAWASTLASQPLAQFYSPKMFADYPPGYLYVLAVIGHVYAFLAPHGSSVLFKHLVKLPAVLMDIVDGYLIYKIGRRFASERVALLASAFFVLNPAVIFISASWGQVDSISAGLALLALYLILRSNDDRSAVFSPSIFCAWIAFAYSLLIKPQAAILIPLFVAFAFLSPERRRIRLLSTAAGILGGFLLALALTLPFHPTANPVSAFAWLYERYTFGKNVYPYNSVNAFNLWTINFGRQGWFWQPDTRIVFGFAQYVWGIVLLLAATALIVIRYIQSRTDRALVEGAALLTLAFFMLATRMHERYLFDGLLFTIAAIPLAARYLWTSAVFTVTLFVNLFYSLTYLQVVTQSTPGVNALDMWSPWPHLLSILNVGAFFYLGYVYLGSSDQPAEAAAGAAQMPHAALPARLRLEPRSWFDPKEGLAKMLWPLDYVLAGAFGLVSFLLSYVNYWLPNQKVFDEIYFARAAEEYLTHKYIYENTHPPLTKLIITLSTMLFGGMPGGDNPHGWRFLDVVFGAVAVVILYAFAKRVTRSTLFASFAALIFTADGMHFVQSRIATPEGIVIVFSLSALYAFYRFWIASQSTVRAYEQNPVARAVVCAAVSLVLGFLGSWPATIWLHGSKASFIVFGFYFAFGFYLLLRLVVVPRFFPPEKEFAAYPDGSFLLRGEGGALLKTPDGGCVDTQRKNPVIGAISRANKGGLTLAQDGAEIAYARDGSVRYSTPAGSATYTPGLVTSDTGETQEGRHATGWLICFTVLLGALVASKWYGVMAYGVSFTVVTAVWLQRYWTPMLPKRWGNPFGFRLDVTIAAIVFLSVSVYIAVWIPDFIRQIEIKNLSDLVYRQYTMFEYHDTLKATHPYQSVWWQWPLDLRPIAYFWNDSRTGLNAGKSTACCVSEIISLPNPLILWFGVLCVPVVGILAWIEKNKGYALLVIAYLLQWLPWALSPRITFAYHYYVDIPIVVLCNVIVLQRIWHLGDHAEDGSVARLGGRIAVGAYVLAVVAAFIWFYPILSATPIPWNAWWARMWLGRLWV